MSAYLLYKGKHNNDNHFDVVYRLDTGSYKYQVYLPGWQMLSKGIKISQDKLSILKILIIYNLLYWLFWRWQRKEFKMHLLYDKNKVVHYCFVLPKTFRIPAMRKADLEIGPYYTHPDYRGKGITPYMVGKIIQDHPTTDFYVLVRSENRPSIKVLEKNSLSLVGACNREKLLRVLPKFVLMTN